jgi:hypothetical protein
MCKIYAVPALYYIISILLSIVVRCQLRKIYERVYLSKGISHRYNVRKETPRLISVKVWNKDYLPIGLRSTDRLYRGSYEAP